MNKNNILRLTFSYVKQIGVVEPYKIQFLALKKFFNVKSHSRIGRHNKAFYFGKMSSNHIKQSYYVRDLLYKNDYMTPRMAVLMTPKMYTYYSFQVFKFICKVLCEPSNSDTLSFSTDHVSVFYAGFFKLHPQSIRDCVQYKASYRMFQERRTDFRNSRVLKVDIKDFFIGITPDRLEHALRKLCKVNNVNQTQTVSNIINFIKESGYGSLPQSQSCLASSMLSQVYLIEFTEALEKKAADKRLRVVRYVDDMYIELPDNFRDRDVNDLVDWISSELWQYGLNLNLSKAKLFSKRQYIENTSWANVPVGVSGAAVPVSEAVQQKISGLLGNNGFQLSLFWEEVEKLWRLKQRDISGYFKLVNKYFSIEGDNSNKVLNGIIFGGMWKSALSLDKKKALAKFPEIMEYDPMKYVTFLTLVESNIKALDTSYASDAVKSYVEKSHLNGANGYTLRQGLIDINYYIQNKQFIDNSDANILLLNQKYIEFIRRYVL